MIKTPRTIPIVLTAGQEKTVPVVGRFMHVRSCTVASFKAAFDNDPLETFYPGGTYPAGDQFGQVRVKDSLGGGCTIILIVADAKFAGVYDAAMLSSMDATLTGMAADIAALESLLEVPDTVTQIAEATIAQTGVGEDQLVVAAATNRKVMIMADFQNTGEIYLGSVTGITAANAPVHLQPGDSWPVDYAGDVYACSGNGTEKARGYVIAIA